MIHLCNTLECHSKFIFTDQTWETFLCLYKQWGWYPGRKKNKFKVSCFLVTLLVTHVRSHFFHGCKTFTEQKQVAPSIFQQKF